MTSYAIKTGSTQHRQNTRTAIAERREFKTSGSLSGGGLTGSTGQLYALALKHFYLDVNRGIDYVVYSYTTPIAWHTGDGWTVVTDKFSVTTTTHQSVVRRALADAGLESKEVGS